MGHYAAGRLHRIVLWRRACDAWVQAPAPTMPFLALLGAWVLLNVADVTSTLLAMRCGGPCGHFQESNPISLALVGQGGVRALLLAKGLTTAAGVGLLAVGWRHLPRGCFWLAVAVNVGMAFTVANNFFWLVL